METLTAQLRGVALAMLMLLAGCATNTITGRSQLMLVSEDSAIRGSASAYVNLVGEFSKKGKVETGTERVAQAQRITNRLIAEAVRFRPDSASWHWEIQVIDEPKTVNAFCMAGGKMGIYTGFWDKFHASDDEIANVMGHEIGHALASHTREQMSVAMTVGVGAALLGALASSNSASDPYAYQRTQSTAALAAALAITLPNSREAENEADQIGIELAARAGFDPRAAVSLWEKMAQEGGTPPEFLSTHPSPENRMKRLEELIAQVAPLYAAATARPGAPIPDFVSGSVNERAVGGLSREAYAKKIAAEPQVMTFVSGEFERFRRGETVFECGVECAFSYAYHKGDWTKLHGAKSWRDLAIAVIKVGYANDLSYLMLGEAASGMGLGAAAKTYYSRALAARAAGKTCGGAFDTCEGFDVAKLARAGAGP